MANKKVRRGFIMVNRLNEDMIGRLAAQFNTLPDMLRGATDMYVPDDENPSFYKGYVTGVMIIAGLLNQQKVEINYEALVAIAAKAAQVRQGLLDEEANTDWLDKLDDWLRVSQVSESGKSHHN